MDCLLFNVQCLWKHYPPPPTRGLVESVWWIRVLSLNLDWCSVTKRWLMSTSLNPVSLIPTWGFKSRPRRVSYAPGYPSMPQDTLICPAGTVVAPCGVYLLVPMFKLKNQGVKRGRGLLISSKPCRCPPGQGLNTGHSYSPVPLKHRAFI